MQPSTVLSPTGRRAAGRQATGTTVTPSDTRHHTLLVYAAGAGVVLGGRDVRSQAVLLPVMRCAGEMGLALPAESNKVSQIGRDML